jgi:hypothetical protein
MYLSRMPLQVAVQLTDAQVDEFCAAATNPAMAKATQTMHTSRGAAGTKARLAWQARVKVVAEQQAKLSASNMRRAGNSSTTNTSENQRLKLQTATWLPPHLLH